MTSTGSELVVDAEISAANEWLSHLEQLGAEIETAMAAISTDRLAQFEQSVRRQEALCGELKRLAGQLTERANVRASGKANLPAPLSSSAADTGLAARLKSTTASLQLLNYQYAALLKHSGQSIRLLASLCSSYTGPTNGTAGRAKQQTWSCEV